jgi:hypothetical protein
MLAAWHFQAAAFHVQETLKTLLSSAGAFPWQKD